MSTEKTDAIVIRQADFSESSRVLTLFTRDFGKVSCLAKGVKRLKSAFEVSLDILSQCRLMFLHKSSGGLDLLTESQLIKRFQPRAGSLNHLYSGYYIAELLNSLTEEADPHLELYSAAIDALRHLETMESAFLPVTRFELCLLREIGQLPDLTTCTICQSEKNSEESVRFWVSQSGLVCSRCGDSEYQTTEFQPGSLSILRKLAEEAGSGWDRIESSPRQKKEIRKLMNSVISHVVGRRPKTLPLLKLT